MVKQLSPKPWMWVRFLPLTAILPLVLLLSACTVGSVDSDGIWFARLWTDTYIETPTFIYSSDAEASSDNKVLTDLISKIP